MEKINDEEYIDNLKKSYFLKKEELDLIRSDATLKKWKVLSKAYKIGKEIWGRNFTRRQLSKDMELPMTTVLRCLALDRVNPKNWKLQKEGKISVFKLAMICSLKQRTYQDEIVQLVIKDNLSTYEIKRLKVQNLKDINHYRHKIATERGYSRRDSALTHFLNWIIRGKAFMLMDKKHLGEDYNSKIKPKLKELNLLISKYLD